MMEPDYDAVVDRSATVTAVDTSQSPSRRGFFQQQRNRVSIETTSQMHSLDYNNNVEQNEYYNISTTAATNNHRRENHRLQENNIDAIPQTKSSVGRNNITSSSGSSSGGWLSLLWVTKRDNNNNNDSAITIKDNNRNGKPNNNLDTTTSVSVTEVLDEISDHNNNDIFNRNDDVHITNNNSRGEIAPNSPKRRPRNYYSQFDTQQQYSASKLNSTADNDDDTRTETEYSTLNEQQQQQQTSSIRSTGELLYDDCSFFFQPSSLSCESDQNSSAGSGGQRRLQKQHEWKTIRRDQYKRHNSSGGGQQQSIMYEYSDAVSVTPMPILQRYRTKYAQLNSELITERGSHRNRHQQYFHYYYDQQDQYHDVLEHQRDPFDDWYMQQSSLQLQEYDATTITTINDNDRDINNMESTPYYNANDTILASSLRHGNKITNKKNKNNNGIVRSDTARQSSLFFRVDGRIVMRLPRDRVRLLVDPDLEVGVLSVEQWRVVKNIENDNVDHHNNNIVKGQKSTLESVDDERNGVYDFRFDNGNGHQTYRPIVMKRNEDYTPLPELRYVLTVSDDLYRKIVEEMSPTTSTKYFCCCTRGCCNDEEKVDIRIAFGLFAATLFILFINMMAFREH